MISWLLRAADRLRDRARRRSWTRKAAAGRRGEDLAHRYLEKRGWTVVARNWRPRSGRGEIDLIAWDGPTLVFVEVKSRTTGEFGAPERNVDRAKRHALMAAAREYATRAGVPRERIRCDVLSVVLKNPPEVTHLTDAVRLPRSL